MMQRLICSGLSYTLDFLRPKLGVRTWGGLLVVGLLAMLLAASAQAQTTNWVPATGGTASWSEPANWNNGVPNGATADASIKVNLPYDSGTSKTIDLLINLTDNTTVNAIRFEDTGSGTDSRLMVGPSSGYTFTFGGSNPIVESVSSTGGGYGLQINPVVDVGTSGVTKMGGGTARFNNRITGSGTITVQQGTLEVVGSSSGFSGAFVVNNGAALQARGFSETGADVLGDTTNGVTLNGTGRFQFRDVNYKTSSESFVVNGINTKGSIMMYASGAVTINGSVTLNSDTSFSVGDYATNGVGSKRDFFINSIIADGTGGPHSVYFLGDYTGSTAQGTESRKGEMVLGAESTYGGTTYVTCNAAPDGTGPFTGNLRLGIDNPLPAGTTVILGGAHNLGTPGTLGHVQGNGKLALAGHNQELAGLLANGAGTANRVVGNSATLSTLTLNIASGTNTYTGFLGWTDANDNNLALVKTGAGILELTAANTYAGGTTLLDGTLLVNNTTGSATGGGPVNVASGATLAGNGTISGLISVAAGGHLGAGLHADNVTFASGASFDVALNSAVAGSGYAPLHLSGSLNLTDAQLNVLLGFSPMLGDQFTIIDKAGVQRVTGDFAGLDEGSLFLASSAAGSQQFQITYLGGDGNDVVLTAVPEPSSLAILAGVALLGLFFRRRPR